MTAARHTLASLKAMADRELEAAVASVLFGETVSRVELPGGGTGWAMVGAMVPCYTRRCIGFGEIIGRMRELGWNYDVDATAPDSGIGVCFDPMNPAFRATGTSTTLPRAAAIADILAVQGAE